jgi:hypothetical protein
MSGGYEEGMRKDQSDVEESQLMQGLLNIGLDRKTAGKAILLINVESTAKFEKWKNNFLKLQSNKAEEIYQLLKKLKSETPDMVKAIEEQVLKLITGNPGGEKV